MTGPGAKAKSDRSSRSPPAAASVSLEDFFENGAVPLHVVDGDGTILRANKAELELLGYSANEYIGRSVAEFHADADVIADILARLTRGETLRRYPARLRAYGGSIKHVEITSSGQFHDGRFINTRCFTMDVTDLVRAREELRRKDAYFQQVLDALPAAVFMTDAAGKLTYLNRTASDLAQTSPRIGVDEWHTIFRLFTPDGEEMSLEERPMYRALAEDRPVWGVEALVQRTDGSFLPVMPFPTPIHDETGALAGVVNMFVDISHQQRAAERERLLVGELHHRTSNLFAVVHALASRSLTGDMTLDQARETFKARLSAMARTHNKLIEKSWAEVAVQEVVSLELEPFPGQVEARGPESPLPPAQVQNLSLALHELTTNATKHGALSVPEGKVLVTWSEEVRDGQRMLKLRWEERGGPSVAPPSRRGFGGALLKRLFPGVNLHFAQGGLICEFGVAATAPPNVAQEGEAIRSGR